ncbi:hypothetical protein XO09_03430 [Thermosipho sp. 1223]|nr:hypothetical protein [Thermosipho sp. 1244]OOC47040.1 hypothetical protein XO09_03430 [Thermosipho sp. 1223]
MKELVWVLIAGVISGFISPFLAKTLVNVIELINILWGNYIVFAPVIAFWIVGLLEKHSKLILGTGVNSYKNKKIHITLKDLILKYISTMITLGFGGSGGLVSPILFIGKGLSEIFSKKFGRIFTISFASGMLTYYLGTPLSAAFLSVEYFEKDTVSYEDLMPALLSSMISIFHVRILGFTPIFIEKFSKLNIENVTTIDIIFSIIFAMLFGGIGMLAYILKFYFRNYINRLDSVKKTLTSGLLVSLTGIIFGSTILGLKVFFGGKNVEKLIIGKILATVFTIESLGSCGYFTPLTIVGMNLGVVVGNFGFNSSIFSIVGLSALLSSMLNLPIAAVIFPLELFGYKALIPAAIGSSVSYLLFKKFRLE